MGYILIVWQTLCYIVSWRSIFLAWISTGKICPCCVRKQNNSMFLFSQSQQVSIYVYHSACYVAQIDSKTFHDDVIKWKHFPRCWPFVRGIRRSPVRCPHKVQWRGALMFSLICDWINGWVNNREAGDLRRHRDLYDVTVMLCDNNFESLNLHSDSYIRLRQNWNKSFSEKLCLYFGRTMDLALPLWHHKMVVSPHKG